MFNIHTAGLPLTLLTYIYIYSSIMMALYIDVSSMVEGSLKFSFEQRTFRVLGECDNHCSTEP